MTTEKLIEYFGGIDDCYVKEAAPGNRPARKRWRALAGAAAVVVLAAVAAGIPALWGGPEPDQPAPLQPDPALSHDVMEDDPGCAPGHIRWRGSVYVDRGQAVYEMPEGLELLGEVNRVVPEGGIVPEDAPDLSSSFGEGGSAYMFPGNDTLIVFRYKEWDPEMELGRKEPILLLFRESDEEEPHQPGQPYYTLSDMMEDSDAIVEGAAPEPGGADPVGAGEAVYTLQVTSVLQGSVEAETVQVRIPADSGVFEASRDDSYLLFLRREADGTFRPVSTFQGVYAIEGRFLHIPANDPFRVGEMPVLHTDDNDFWEGVDHVREKIDRLQRGVEAAVLTEK